MTNLIEYTYDALDALQGNPANNFIQNTAVAAKNVVCELYRDYAGWTAGTPDLTGFNGVFHGFWRGVCGNDPAGLPVPTPPPNGGQCPIRYDIVGRVGAGCPQPEDSPTIIAQNILGPIRGFNVSESGFRPNPPSACRVKDIVVSFADGEGANRSYGFTSQELSGGGSVALSPRFIPVGGVPDNCGNGTPSFNPSPPPAERLSPTVSVPITNNVNVAIPVNVFVPPLPPSINIRVGALNFNFDLGGVTVDFAPELPPAPRPPAPTLPRPMPPQKSNECPDYAGRFDSIDRDLDDLKDCDRCEKKKTFVSQQVVSGNSGIANVPENTYAVALTLTQVPSNAREQIGELAPRVLYAGWAWFVYDGKLGDRQPVDSDGKAYLPDGEFPPTGFAYTLYEGFVGTATARYYTLPQE